MLFSILRSFDDRNAECILINVNLIKITGSIPGRPTSEYKSFTIINEGEINDCLYFSDQMIRWY